MPRGRSRPWSVVATVAALATVVGCSSAVPALESRLSAVPSGDGDTDHVVVISIDGVPADLWSQPDLPVPNLRRLAAEGSSAERMTVSNPSSTWSSHTTVITGLSPKSHGVLFNGQIVLQGPGKPPLTEQWARSKRRQEPSSETPAHPRAPR